MSRGQRVILESGKRGILSGGSQSLFDASGECAECCGVCTASETLCENCDDVTPSQYQVTISGIATCPACFLSFIGAGSDISFTVNSSLNNTFTLSQNPLAPCTWSFAITNGFTYTLYDSIDGSCLGAVTEGPATTDIIVELRRISFSWVLNIYSTVRNLDFFFDVQGELSAGECAVVPAFTSDYTAAGDCGADPVAFQVAGYGGSATVVCL